MEEGFVYNWSSLKETFGNFKTDYDSDNTKAKEWGYGDNGKTRTQVTAEDKRSIANWAYGKNPKAKDLGNTPITSNWSDQNADGWKYRGSGFIQLTGKSNFKSITNKYNTWIARLNEDIQEEDFVATPDKVRTNKVYAMAAALIYWKRENLLTRSDMGANEDALKAITYKINSAFKGYEHRLDYLEKAIKVLGVEDCTDFKRRKGQKGTVVVVSGSETKLSQVKGRNNVLYKTYIYRSMTLKQYSALKEKDNLPEADYITYLTRDAHQAKSERIDIQHSVLRYGKHNECPPSDKYYLNNKKDAMGDKYLMYVSDSPQGSKITVKDTLEGDMDVAREGIAIHQYDRIFSLGCLTLASSTDTTPVNNLYNEIPNLYVHKQLEGKTRVGTDDITYDMSIERQHVRLILEERKVTKKEKQHENFDKYIWTGVHKE